MTPEREHEIRVLAAAFTRPGSKHAKIGRVLADLLTEIDALRERATDAESRE